MKEIRQDLEDVIRANIEDAKRLCDIAEKSGDKDFLKHAKEDYDKWKSELSLLHERGVM